jgi:UDP-3-O-[3-hydroxymyristoyl] N-acetylglucosamine deacetylase
MGNTVEKTFELSGVGLHLGVNTTVRVMPGSSGEGRYFVRVDLPEKPKIPAQVDAVGQTTLSTELVAGEAKVRTVEHLLASLVASGIDDARIEINGEEVPLLDGSAKIWCNAIALAGIRRGNSQIICRGERPFAPTEPIAPAEPIWIRENDAFVAALPAPETRFTYGIDFPYQAIGNQWHSWNPSQESFATEIAPARTFGFAEQIEQLQQAGLIQGGSLDNALVCSHDGWVNPPLRFTNEPARHKLLDLVGDISLLGQLPLAHFIAYKASHKLHIQLAKRIADLLQVETSN